jgi:hypothetical protein
MKQYAVYRGFQDEFSVVAIFKTKKEAVQYIVDQGWDEDDSPITPSVWIQKLDIRPA